MNSSEGLIHKQMKKAAINFYVCLMECKEIFELIEKDEIQNNDDLFRAIETLPSEHPLRVEYEKLQSLPLKAREQIYEEAKEHIYRFHDSMDEAYCYISELKEHLLILNDQVLLETNFSNRALKYKSQLKHDIEDLLSKIDEKDKEVIR